MPGTPEFIGSTTKEEALAALVHAWRIWESMPHEDTEEDLFFRRYEDEAERFGASEYELIRANFKGISAENRQSLFEGYCFEGFDFKKLEDYIEHLKSMTRIRDEFNLVDPFQKK